MTAIIMRSALVYHGHKPAPDVHSIEVDWRGDRHVVTWADVMRRRRERQAAILENKRWARHPRALRFWVAYFDMDLFGGWQAFLGDFRGRRGETWIDRDGRLFIPHAMRLFPLVAADGQDEQERWEGWKPAFAGAYRRGTHHGRPRGCAFLWRDGTGEYTSVR